jgi:hypothetical protein
MVLGRTDAVCQQRLCGFVRLLHHDLTIGEILKGVT